MKKIIILIILVGAFNVSAYTSESAETDKYLYLVVPVIKLEDSILYPNPAAFICRINKKTDEMKVAKLRESEDAIEWETVRDRELEMKNCNDTVK